MAIRKGFMLPYLLILIDVLVYLPDRVSLKLSVFTIDACAAG